MKDAVRWYRSLSRERQKQMAKACPHEFVRDWMISDVSSLKLTTAPTLIMHLPSRRWRAFKMPYGEALDLLKSTARTDRELTELLYEV